MRQKTLQFAVVDHNVFEEPENIYKFYLFLKRQGIDSISFDWRWKDIQPEKRFHQKVLGQYRKAAELSIQAGMASPTIILSSPPVWAKKLYRESPLKFLLAFKKYLYQVKNEINKSKELSVKRVQLFNELNNTIYTPFEREDLPMLFKLVKEVFQEENKEVKIIAHLLVGNLTEFQGRIPKKLKKFPAFRRIPFQKSIKEYLEFLKENQEIFDIISVSYYPGVWHIGRDKMRFLENTLKEVATWRVEYEIGEIGFPTNSFWGDQIRQVEEYRRIAVELKKIIRKFKKKGLKTLSRITFYEASDHNQEKLIERFLTRTPYPELSWGLKTADKKPKLILRQEKGKTPLSYILKDLKNI